MGITDTISLLCKYNIQIIINIQICIIFVLHEYHVIIQLYCKIDYHTLYLVLINSSKLIYCTVTIVNYLIFH